MSVPELTNLQFLVLVLLLDSEVEGRDLRALMAGEGASMGRPAFYRLMSRLEDAKLVSGRYERREVGGETVRVRKYRITKAGCRARESMFNFVSAWGPGLGRLGIEGA